MAHTLAVRVHDRRQDGTAALAITFGSKVSMHVLYCQLSCDNLEMLVSIHKYSTTTYNIGSICFPIPSKQETYVL